MPWSDRVSPVAMQRVALVAPHEALRDLLVRVADTGVVEVDLGDVTEAPAGEATVRSQRAGADAVPLLTPEVPDLDALERAGRIDLLAGEAELERVRAAAVIAPPSPPPGAEPGSVCALAGWAPAEAVPALAGQVAGVGGAVVPLPRPPGALPPTLLRTRRAGQPFSTLVQAYATVPYADVDPTPYAAAAYVVMFGMMFGDVGHGLLLVLVALLARRGRPRLLGRVRPAAPLIAAAGVSGAAFGLLYGEFFGPTGVVPVLWISPTEEPLTLLVAALALGAVLLAGAYALGAVNRVREGGWLYAVYAPAGIAGATLFLGAGLVVAGLALDVAPLTLAGVVVAATGLVLAFVGLRATAGGGAAGVAEASIELFDLVLRLGSNVVSFARLAAFGLTHAALAAVVWDATTALWGSSSLGPVLGPALAAVVFVVGNAAAFALEAVVAAVQALRLEYYELFSRVFQAEGRPFRPWHVPLAAPEPAAARPPQEARP